MLVCILLRSSDGDRGKIYADHLIGLHTLVNVDSQRTRTRTQIHDDGFKRLVLVGHPELLKLRHRPFGEHFRFRARNEHARANGEVQDAKGCRTYDVLQWLTLLTSFHGFVKLSREGIWNLVRGIETQGQMGGLPQKRCGNQGRVNVGGGDAGVDEAAPGIVDKRCELG